MSTFKINLSTQFFIKANDYDEALQILNKRLDKIGAESYRETFSDEDYVSHTVKYYTIETEDGFVIEEFDTLKEANNKFKAIKSKLAQDYDEIYICGFIQQRNYADDCLDEEEIYSKEYVLKERD